MVLIISNESDGGLFLRPFWATPAEIHNLSQIPIDIFYIFTHALEKKILGDLFKNLSPLQIPLTLE